MGSPFWLPATLIGAVAVMWAIVMAGLLIGCATAAYVFNRVSLLRSRNMHPAGLSIHNALPRGGLTRASHAD